MILESKSLILQDKSSKTFFTQYSSFQVNLWRGIIVDILHQNPLHFYYLWWKMFSIVSQYVKIVYQINSPKKVIEIRTINSVTIYKYQLQSSILFNLLMFDNNFVNLLRSGFPTQCPVYISLTVIFLHIFHKKNSTLWKGSTLKVFPKTSVQREKEAGWRSILDD